MPPQLDLETILKAKKGDRLAFRRVVEKFQGYLYSVAFRYLGGTLEAEDAVQETFIKVWKNIQRYDTNTKFSTWLYKILVNHCLDMKKQSVFRGQKNLISIEGSVDQAISSTPMSELTNQEISVAIAIASEALAEKQKMVFVLRDLEGLEPGEVSKLLDMDDTQVKSNLYHARKKIGELIKKKFT